MSASVSKRPASAGQGERLTPDVRASGGLQDDRKVAAGPVPGRPGYESTCVVDRDGWHRVTTRIALLDDIRAVARMLMGRSVGGRPFAGSVGALVTQTGRQRPY